MSAPLTVNLDAVVFPAAAPAAGAAATTLSEVVVHQFRVKTRNWQASRADQTPVTDALRGAVTPPPDCDERAAPTEELHKEHGFQR